MAGYLRRLTLDEIPIAIAFLTGETRQGKLGLAYAELHYGASGTPAPQPSLTLKEVDAAFAELAATSGKRASAVRAKRLGTAAFEWKLDGARVQIHKSGVEVRVYTRNLNDVTARVPEIVEVAFNEVQKSSRYSGGDGPALCARESLSSRQAARGSGHHKCGAPDLRSQGAPR